jgi:hypothetical protein
MANMQLIETKTAGAGGVSNFDFTSIPATYTDLYILCSLRSSISANADDIYIQFNNSSSNFNWKNIVGVGSGAPVSQNNTNNQVGTIPAASMTAGSFGNASIYITSYASANYKSVSSDSVAENNATRGDQAFYSTLWSNTAAITSVKLLPSSGTFLEFSTASLYGISNVTSGTKATGGVVSSDGTYYYHMFPFSGTFTPTTAVTVDYLVVAGGGGGGGGYRAGGGGAGGLRSTVTATGGGGSLETALSLTANTAYTVTVGGGGVGVTNANGTSGSNSVFSSITSTGGGYGGGSWDSGNAGAVGGSGGGGIGSSSTGGAGGARTASPVQGFNGGSGYSGNIQCGGGGGGAGAVGQNGGSGGTDGDGGTGVQITSFANATQTGADNGYYAAGGGGGNYGSGNVTIGGTGGAGAGGSGDSPYKNGVSAVVNTGSGGGGASGDSYKGGNGGSGLVIIRYAI